MIFREGRCPLCGTAGKRDRIGWFCPTCGTIFDHFGIINSEEEIGDFEWT